MSFLLEICNISKIYPNGVLANNKVSLNISKGEIHAIVGENGAGKSTLMKILYGLEQPSEGEIFLNGKLISIKNTHKAIDLKIGMVHQNFMLINSFTVAENIVLGCEPKKGIKLNHHKSINDTKETASMYGLNVDPYEVIDNVPVGMRQRVEILKALYRGAEILILDEPTAVLTPQETNDLFSAIKKLVKNGKTVIFITHKLREVLEISNVVTVMRDSKVVSSLKTSETSVSELARMMVGREVFMSLEKPKISKGKHIMIVKNLTYTNEAGRPLVNNVSFSLSESEIVGIAGVEGNGQTELVEVLTGLKNASSGTITMNDVHIIKKGPRAFREARIAHIPEDRLLNGLAKSVSIEENLIIDRYYLEPFTKNGFLKPYEIALNSRKLITDYGIKTKDGKSSVDSLSGGNMQKVIVAREFSSSPKLLIAAQPTRGIDIGAIEFIHQQLIDKRTNGLSILLVSADLQEVMKLSDKIMVMFDGEIVAVFKNSLNLTEETIGMYMLGAKKQSKDKMEEVLLH